MIPHPRWEMMGRPFVAAYLNDNPVGRQDLQALRHL